MPIACSLKSRTAPTPEHSANPDPPLLLSKPMHGKFRSGSFVDPGRSKHFFRKTLPGRYPYKTTKSYACDAVCASVICRRFLVEATVVSFPVGLLMNSMGDELWAFAFNFLPA